MWWKLRQKKRFLWFYKQVYRVWMSINGADISWYTHFDNKPCLPHGIKGIFISGAVRIGKNCVIFQQVTIGANTLIGSKSMGEPAIGDNCYIGAGAKIVGNARVGNNVRVGVNAVVYRDIPDNHTVVSETKIFESENSDNRFYHFTDRWEYFDKGGFHDVSENQMEAIKRVYCNAGSK